MCLDSFWKDKHNSRMSVLSDQLYLQREVLTTISKSNSKDYFQRIDGVLEQKPRKGFWGFLTGPSYYQKDFVYEMNDEYKRIKFEMGELSRKALKDM